MVSMFQKRSPRCTLSCPSVLCHIFCHSLCVGMNQFLPDLCGAFAGETGFSPPLPTVAGAFVVASRHECTNLATATELIVGPIVNFTSFMTFSLPLGRELMGGNG